MNARERRLSLMLLGCVGVLLIAFFAMWVLPTYQSMSQKADDATTAKNSAEAALSAAQKLNPEEINNRLDNLKARVPRSLELPNVINRIDDLAILNNLIWLQGTPEDVTSATSATTNSTATPTGQAATQAPQLDRHDFSIVVRGTMDDLTKFMAGLTDKSIGRIIVVNALDLQFREDEGPTAVDATLKLQVVGWKEGASIDSSGCTEKSEVSEAASGSNDPKCNQSTVKK